MITSRNLLKLTGAVLGVALGTIARTIDHASTALLRRI